MRVKQDEPFELQPRANAALARVLRVGAGAALVVSVADLAVGGMGADAAGRALAWAALGIVVAVPLGRVGLLGIRWVARRDYLFAVLAFGLLAIVVVGGVLAIRT